MDPETGKTIAVLFVIALVVGFFVWRNRGGGSGGRGGGGRGGGDHQRR